MINEIMKNVVGASSGMMMKIADFSEQNFSASISVSKHSSCSSSESKNALSRESAVDMTLAIDCSAAFSAAPANHFALCVFGNKSMSCWNWFLPFFVEGANSSCMILKTDTICRFCGAQNSATNRIVAVRIPSAAS